LNLRGALLRAPVLSFLLCNGDITSAQRLLRANSSGSALVTAIPKADIRSGRVDWPNGGEPSVRYRVTLARTMMTQNVTEHRDLARYLPLPAQCHLTVGVAAATWYADT
jgi:hypothetical protein